MLVMKFGGSSVADRTQVDKVIEIVRSRIDRKPVIVSSAHKGITNALVECARQAAKGNPDPSPAIERQREIAAGMGCPPDMLDGLFTELTDLLRGISLVKEASARSVDYVSSFGERMSVRCIAYYMRAQGLPAQAYDIWDLGFITDGNFGRARPLKSYESAMRRAVDDIVAQGTIPVITGFIGKTEAGDITTVGRNGSDLTGTLVGAAVGAHEVEIWTDTNGVMTADPRKVPGARSITEMSYDEASELAWFGGKVLHPSSLQPAIAKRIPVRVLNTNEPEHPGTVIRHEVTSAGDFPATSIAHKSGQMVLTIATPMMLGEVGYLARIFEIMARHKVVIDMVSTSEVSISMTTESVELLNGAIKELEQFGKCTVLCDKAVLCVVGRNISRVKGLGMRVFGALADANINVDMISHGIGSINLTMLLDQEFVDEAVKVLHEELFEQGA